MFSPLPKQRPQYYHKRARLGTVCRLQNTPLTDAAKLAENAVNRQSWHFILHRFSHDRQMFIEMSPKFWLAAKAFRKSRPEYAAPLTSYRVKNPTKNFKILI